MWVYCGGRTTNEVIKEIEKEYSGEIVGYETLEGLINVGEKKEDVKGILVTDMSLSTLLSYQELREVSEKYKGVRVVAITTREQVPEKETLPENLNLMQEDKVRLTKLIEVMTGDEG